MNIMKKELVEFEYIFNSIYSITPQVIEAMVLLLKNNLYGVKLYDFGRDEYAPRLPSDQLFDLTYKNMVMVKGFDRNSMLDTEFWFRPNTEEIRVVTKQSRSAFARIEKEETPFTSDEEMKAYFSVYCRDLETKAQTYIKIGECYQKLISTARKYVESGFDKKYAEFSDDGYSIDLAYLYSPPQREK